MLYIEYLCAGSLFMLKTKWKLGMGTSELMLTGEFRILFLPS